AGIPHSVCIVGSRLELSDSGNPSLVKMDGQVSASGSACQFPLPLSHMPRITTPTAKIAAPARLISQANSFGVIADIGGWSTGYLSNSFQLVINLDCLLRHNDQ